MASRLSSIVMRLGLRGFAELVLSPVLIPLLTMLSWPRALWESRDLVNGRWGRHQGFHPLNAINCLYYKTQWTNIDRYGFAGVSPIIGVGSYPLSNWFHLSALSSCLFASAGATVMLLGTVFWVFMHAIWFWVVQWHWVILVIAVLFFSSTTYLMAFMRQNYNIVGWMWLPLGIFGILSNQLGLAAVAWFAASLGSITAVFVAVPIVAAISIVEGNYYLLLSLIPAFMKLALHLVPMLRSGNLRSGLTTMAKLIGLTRRGVRYKRKSMRLEISSLYFYLIYSVACALLYVGAGDVPVIPLVALGLFVANQNLMRFADEESLVILFTSVLAATVMLSPWDWWSFTALVVAMNPLPAVFGGQAWRRTGSLVRMEYHSPFDQSRIEKAMRAFLTVSPDQRVLFAFDDPQDEYERVFDGYRVLLELPLFVAADKGVHLMPDWYAIAETNYAGSPDFWGRSPQEVLTNAQHWGASHVIVYQDTGTALDPAWLRDFEPVSEFDWGDWTDELRGVALWSTEKPPKWWLLKVVAPPDGNP